MKQTNWNRSSIENIGQIYDLLLLFIAVLTVISLIVNQTLIFLVVGFVGIYVLLIRIYDKRIGRKLILENRNRSIRLFEGDEGYLDIRLFNHSFLPFLNSSISFSTNQKVYSDDFVKNTRGKLNYYQVPFVLHGKSESYMPISVQAMKRGVILVENIRLAFPNLLNFERMEMPLHEKYQTEIVIYPKPLPVAGIEEFPYNNFGNQVTPYSPFEDLLSPVGTRDYVQSDPFHRIHWKASAKNQTLQTKIYERNQNISWTVIVNIAETSPVGNIYRSSRMEELLSQATYICQMITKRGYPIKICINASRIGNVPFFIDVGIGPEHLKKILELLARIEDDNNTIPVANAMHRMDRLIEVSDMIIVIGTLDQQSLLYTNKWNKQGNRVFQVSNNDNGAYLSERLYEYETK